MTDPTGSEAYTYDALGRVTAMAKTINGVSYPLGYTYDFASDLTSITYPSGRVVQQTTDTLGRLQQITSSGVNYVSNLAYNAAWQPTGFSVTAAQRNHRTT
jgi:YD repeat-containing protein